ncbi:DNA-entry nuclease [Anaerobacillus sp. CMMVII]|uniref:DNA-entry nuclease n=1 Tax=Anaerobacillus sp. CMMVII TaxID=2755588 RepID=UPI0021B6EB64|nr:DNA-entry nuclease [Anaerobacillus sp. CMMVII]MCT8138611.1 DNA-entry nuclease [Anaerobacillus sp. CMMVII]
MTVEVSVEVDQSGRMMYNPIFHPNNGKRYSESDLEYLCKYWEIDDWRTMGFALGRTEKTLSNTVSRLRKEGLYDYYKNLNKHW